MINATLFEINKLKCYIFKGLTIHNTVLLLYMQDLIVLILAAFMVYAIQQPKVSF